jgi:hypothetical protein
VVSAWDGFDEVLTWQVGILEEGNFLWPIQWKYRVPYGVPRDLFIVNQTFHADADGNVTISKGGHTEKSFLLDPNSSYVGLTTATQKQTSEKQK